MAKLKQGQVELNFDLESSREEIHKLTQQINTAEQQLNRVSVGVGVSVCVCVWGCVKLCSDVCIAYALQLLYFLHY